MLAWERGREMEGEITKKEIHCGTPFFGWLKEEEEKSWHSEGGKGEVMMTIVRVRVYM